MDEEILAADGLVCTVPSEVGSRTVFNGLTLHLHSGEIVDLTGPSGSGKSSLLTALAQLNPNANAKLSLHGRDSSTFTLQQWRREVAYVPQTATLIGADVAEAIRLPWRLHVNGARTGVAHRTARDDSSAVASPDDRHIREALDHAGCTDVELTRPVTDLSGGQTARVCLLRTLLTAPAVLLADEVDAGLDADNAGNIASMLSDAAQHGMAVCRISHRDPDGLASRRLTLESGRLTQEEAL